MEAIGQLRTVVGARLQPRSLIGNASDAPRPRGPAEVSQTNVVCLGSTVPSQSPERSMLKKEKLYHKPISKTRYQLK